MSRLERALGLALIVLAVAIVAGTAYAGVSGSRARKLARAAVPTAVSGAGVFDGLGRVRTKTADERPAVVVVDLAFPYDAADRQFREELTRKRGELRGAATAFLSSRRAAELKPADEGAVKAALRDTLNGLLSLGSIEELYFSEFRVIE